MPKNKVLLAFLILLLSCGRVLAQEGTIYGLTEIDYFGQKGLKKTDTRAIRATVDKKEPPIEQELWLEPAVSADGKVSYYRPPKVVVEFLDDPTRENGVKYLEWNKKRMEKIQTAQTVLKDLAKEMNYLPAPDLPAVQQTPKPTTPAVVSKDQAFVIFFILKGCPYCEKQKGLIADLLKTRPDLRIEVYAKGYSAEEIKALPFTAREDNGLSREFGLNTYPSVFVANKYGKKMIVPGLIERSLLDNLLEQKT